MLFGLRQKLQITVTIKEKNKTKKRTTTTKKSLWAFNMFFIISELPPPKCSLEELIKQLPPWLILRC